MRILSAAVIAFAMATTTATTTTNTESEKPQADAPARETSDAGSEMITIDVKDLVKDRDTMPDDPTMFGRTKIDDFDVQARWSGGLKITGLAKGNYSVKCSTSDKWSYSSGRNWNAEGDPNKDDRGGLVQPAGNFAQLIIYSRTNSSGSRWWIPYNFTYEDFYVGSENYIILQCNDRPGDYGDNGGSIRVTLYKN